MPNAAKLLFAAAKSIVNSIKFTLRAPNRACFCRLELLVNGHLKSVCIPEQDKFKIFRCHTYRIPATSQGTLGRSIRYKNFLHRSCSVRSLHLQLNPTKSFHQMEQIRSLVHCPATCQRSIIVKYDHSILPIETLCRLDNL
jgi:hypothetical protein